MYDVDMYYEDMASQAYAGVQDEPDAQWWEEEEDEEGEEEDE
jgi:hypothetical protein